MRHRTLLRCCLGGGGLSGALLLPPLFPRARVSSACFVSPQLLASLACPASCLPAGPRVLEHIVDTVIYMEGGRQQPVRLVSGVPGVAVSSWVHWRLVGQALKAAAPVLAGAAVELLPWLLLPQVRSIKNRYGNTDEVGVFEMHDDGMQVRLGGRRWGTARPAWGGRCALPCFRPECPVPLLPLRLPAHLPTVCRWSPTPPPSSSLTETLPPMSPPR